MLAAPAAFSAARDLISPPNERVVEPSQSFWSKYQLSPDPWIPRWNPELPTSGQIRALQSKKLLPEDYEFEIPEPPSWAWWDPVENYHADEEIRQQKLATENQMEYLDSLGLLPEDYDLSVHESSEISLNRGEPGIQDVLPWSIYGMFGVVPETGYSYFKTRGKVESSVEIDELLSQEEGVASIDKYEIDKDIYKWFRERGEKKGWFDKREEVAYPDELHDSVVKISLGSGKGTGFFVAPDVVATNFHVVDYAIRNMAQGVKRSDLPENYDELDPDAADNAWRDAAEWIGGAAYVPGEYDIKLMVPGRDEILAESILAVDRANDIALLRVPEVEGVRPFKLSQELAEDEDKLLSLGYPKGVGDRPQLDAGEFVQGYGLWGDPGKDAERIDYTILGGSVYPGESGSPWFDPITGDVYGILWGGTSANQLGGTELGRNTTGFVAGSRDIQRLLDWVEEREPPEVYMRWWDEKAYLLKDITYSQGTDNSGVGAVGKKSTLGYKIDGFEFDVHGSPVPGFNPWLDPHPEGDFVGDKVGDSVGVGSVYGLIASAIFGGVDVDREALYKELGIDISDGISRKEASLLIEYSKKEQENKKSKATEKQIAALTRMYPGKDLSKLTMEQASELFDTYEPPPKMATEAQKKSLTRMYPGKDLSKLTMEQASELFDTYEPPPKMATEAQKKSLTRMYPGKDLSKLTMEQASELFDTYERPARSQDATQAQLDYLDQLRGGGFGDVMPIEFVNEADGLTRQEVSALIDFEKAKQRSAEISRESAGPAMASEAQLRYLGQLNQERYGGLSGATEDVMGIEEITFDDGITALEARVLFDYEDAVRKSRESAGPAMASEAQMQALQRMFPDQFGEVGGGVEEPSMMGIEEITFDDGITRGEAAALFDYGEAVQKSAGPPMASDAQVAALRRYFPQMFEPVEEEPLVPLGEIDFTDGVTREEAGQAFRHVPQMPPPMATERQVARLEMEFPHAFKRVGRVEEYLQSGQSYGVVGSLEDIYDADTFTGRLFDASTGQLFKEDTVRLGDFNAPEIKPDASKPLEYQEREAARARDARDVFRSMVQRFNIGRDVEQEGYVIPIEFRHDAQMLGGLARGRFGRVLGDINFEGVDYEQFMIQQRMGSVYGASVEWGERDIDPLELWRRDPTYLESLGKDTTGLLEQIPGEVVGRVFQGEDPFDSLTETVAQVPSILKDRAIGHAKQTLTRATMDFFKERFTDEFTPNNLSFAQRYIGDFSGVGEKVGVFKDKAAGFLQSGWGAAIAPAALAAGTAIIGERSLDMNYAEVIPTREDRLESFNQYVSQRQEASSGASMSSDEAALRVIKKALREVLSESGLGSMDDLSTKLDRKLRESDRRGITRPR